MLTVYSLVPRADVSPPLAGVALPAGLDVAAALVWLAVLGPVAWGVVRSRSGAQGPVALVEPTLLSPMASPLASVGLASHLAALLRLAPTVVKTHRVV